MLTNRSYLVIGRSGGSAAAPISISAVSPYSGTAKLVRIWCCVDDDLAGNRRGCDGGLAAKKEHPWSLGKLHGPS